jgi:hypothetical protein
MRQTFLTFLFVAASVLCFGQNLISNGRFQYPNMQPRCDGWYNSCNEELTAYCDTSLHCYAGLINQSPSAIPEDIWSLKVKAGFPDEGFAETYITGQSGTHIYELKFWMKAAEWIGTASIGINTQNQFILSKAVSDTSSNWSQFTLIDTLSTQSSDTITVRLSAGTGDFCVCPPVIFAFIELTRRDVTAIDQMHAVNQGISVYPNPAAHKLSIEVPTVYSGNLTLDIYNLVGQQILTRQISGTSISIDKNEMGSGIYLYQLHHTSDKKLVGQGKIIFDE